MAKVIGQYRCSCSYGPIEKSKRLNYCGVHGDDIQDEYSIPQADKQNEDGESNGKIY